MISKLQKLIQDDESVVFGYLFGSQFSKTASEFSDVDIALYFKDYTVDGYLKTIHEIEKTIQKSVDLVVLNKAKNLYLLEDIIKNSIVLKDDPLREDFELRRWHDILDFKELNKRLEIA